MRYAVVIKEAGETCLAFVPDLPGCIATGETVEVVETTIRDAIRFHIDGLRADGEALPLPRTIHVATEPDGESSAVTAKDSFSVFAEWGGPADDEDYGDLQRGPRLPRPFWSDELPLKSSPPTVRQLTTRDPEPPCPSTSPS